MACLALDPLQGIPAVVGAVGAVGWALGVGVFLVTLGWTLRDNPAGAGTGTGEANAERRPVDRFANAFVPVVLAYLALGSYQTLALRTSLPAVLGPYPPRVSHLLGAGAAVLLVFAVGFRLLPRFLVAHPSRALVAVVLPSGSVAPVLLAASLVGRGALFRAGAALEAVAVVGFALALGALFARSDRRRARGSTASSRSLSDFCWPSRAQAGRSSPPTSGSTSSGSSGSPSSGSPTRSTRPRSGRSPARAIGPPSSRWGRSGVD